MVCVDLTELIGECLLKRLSMVGRWRPLFGGGGGVLSWMLGGRLFGEFVSRQLFWFYFVSGEIIYIYKF